MVAMPNTVKNLQAVNSVKRISYCFPYIYFFILYDRPQPLLLDIGLCDREHYLDWMEVWAVRWVKDVLKAQLVHALGHLVASVHVEVVHVEADVVEEVLVSEVL